MYIGSVKTWYYKELTEICTYECNNQRHRKRGFKDSSPFQTSILKVASYLSSLNAKPYTFIPRVTQTTARSNTVEHTCYVEQIFNKVNLY